MGDVCQRRRPRRQRGHLYTVSLLTSATRLRHYARDYDDMTRLIDEILHVSRGSAPVRGTAPHDAQHSQERCAVCTQVETPVGNYSCCNLDFCAAAAATATVAFAAEAADAVETTPVHCYYVS